MIALYVLLALLALVLFSRWGVVVSYEEGKVSLHLRFGYLVFSLPKTEKTAKKNTSAPKEESPVPKKEKQSSFSITDLPELVSMGLDSFGRVLRSVSIDELSLHMVVGRKDPYDTAMTLNSLNAVFEIILNGRIIKPQKLDVSLSPDFVNEQFQAEGRISLSLRPIIIIAVGVAFLSAYLRWKRGKKRALTAERT